MDGKSKKKPAGKQKVWVIGGISMFAVAAVGATLFSLQGEVKSESDLPDEFSVESLKARVGNQQQGRAAFRDLLGRDDLTDEQRRKAMRNMRELRRDRMVDRVNEYFDAAEEDKNVVLDDHIAEFQRRMAEWAERRNDEDRPSEEEREAMRNLFRSRNQAERKNDSESRNPDESARSMAYRDAMRSRMQQRGIQMPTRRGGGGRGGGPGGGGRGGGPGGGGRGGGRP